MRLYQTHKKVLRLHNNAANFLNGLTANSLDKPQNAFVNNHGRIIVTFDQMRISDDEYLIIVEEDFVKPLLDHTERYLRLSKTSVEQKNDFVYFDLDGDYQEGIGEFTIPQKKGKLVLTSRKLPAAVSDEEFTLFRLKYDIPLLGVDYKDDFLLNVSDKDFVSFTKGCFLGQEPISKVHNRSKPSWKLTVKYEDECSEEEKAKMTSKISEPSTHRIKGFVFVRN